MHCFALPFLSSVTAFTVSIETETLRGHFRKGNPGSVIVPLVDSCKITVFVWGKVVLLKSVGNKSH